MRVDAPRKRKPPRALLVTCRLAILLQHNSSPGRSASTSYNCENLYCVAYLSRELLLGWGEGVLQKLQILGLELGVWVCPLPLLGSRY
jgi:hypothetical protein